MSITKPTPQESSARWLSTHYDLPDRAQVRLLRTYTNDVYLVETRDERYVLKVYGAGWREDSQIRFEAELLDHLASRGIPVARAVKGRNGEALQHFVVDGARRPAVLFDYAPGRKPEPPFTPDMYYREGQAVAALHRAADDFQTSHLRRRLDLGTLIDGPSTLIESLAIDDPVKRPILDFGRMIRDNIERLAAAGLDWGVCHGDLTFDNLHITDRGEFVWYDFDSGGYGWRAIDLQGWTILDDEWRLRSEAFIHGYREVRPLSENDIAAAPHLAAALELWGVQVDLERRLLTKGGVMIRDHLASVIDRFAAWQQRLQKSESFPSQ